MTLPEEFVRYTKELLGESMWNAFICSLTDSPPASIRVNPFKCTHGMAARLMERNEKVAWCDNGIYLPERPAFTYDPLFHAGVYYVQEAASMFADRVLKQYVPHPVAMLDLCAAPGGKSTVARTALPQGSILVSNEPVRQRANILVENMQKFGHEDVIVTNNYPADYRRAGIMFDVILADVPCSGEGMFRKDEGAVSEWSVHNVEKCRNLQREIVSDIWHCLKPGGIMIYSTCTFNTKENEENVLFIINELGAELLPVETDGTWGIQGSLAKGFSGPVYRFIPGITRGEGLFMAVMRKNGDAGDMKAGHRNDKKHKKDKAKNTGTIPQACSEWLKDNGRFILLNNDNTITAIPAEWKNMYDVMKENLKVIHAGIALGGIKGKDVIPAQSLAMSRNMNINAFNAVELDYEQAINFLCKEPVALPGDTPRGPVLITYKGVPLGFEKNIGNRANNLYPNEWKIRIKPELKNK